MTRFSKFKKLIDSYFAPELKMEFCCYAYPVRADYDQSSIPRYCVKMDREVIWDYPKDFDVKLLNYAHWADNNGISDLVREYINTPIDGLLEKKFNNETKVFNTEGCACPSVTVNHHLTDLFKAADRRLGKEVLIAWAVHLDNPVVHRIIIKRFKLLEKGMRVSFWERAIIGKEILSRQEPVTLEEAREQALRIKTQGKTKEEVEEITKQYWQIVKEYEEKYRGMK